MKRGDLPLMLVCSLMVLWLASCSDQASTSSGSGDAIPEEVLPDKLHNAFLLLAPHYDISQLSFAMLEVDDGVRMDVNSNGVVRIRWNQNGKSWFPVVPLTELACTIIHELWHYEHQYETTEDGARSAGRECLLKIKDLKCNMTN